MTLGPLIIDIEGLTLTSEDKDILKHPLIGGVILFSRNYESKKQLSSLTKKIKSIHRNDELLICVDQEGGRVQRFKKDFTLLPSFSKIGKTWNLNSSSSISDVVSDAIKYGNILGHELKDVGVDLSFTPVLDIDWARSEVIGDRSFGSDPHKVTVIASSMMHGLLMSGMKNCAKHFPGHGWALSDSHFEDAIDERKFEDIEKNDLVPYKVLCGSNGPIFSVMPSHVTYTNCDKSPAGFSNFWINEILRKQLKFEGIVISDDLSMAAAKIHKTISDSVYSALNAGCDATLICNKRDLVIEVLNKFKINLNNLRLRNLKDLKCKF